MADFCILLGGLGEGECPIPPLVPPLFVTIFEINSYAYSKLLIIIYCLISLQYTLAMSRDNQNNSRNQQNRTSRNNGTARNSSNSGASLV